MESEQLDDQLAGLAYLKTLPYVDSSRLVVAGCSFGGIETLLAAERDVGYKAAIAISPGGTELAAQPGASEATRAGCPQHRSSLWTGTTPPA